MKRVSTRQIAHWCKTMTYIWWRHFHKSVHIEWVRKFILDPLKPSHQRPTVCLTSLCKRSPSKQLNHITQQMTELPLNAVSNCRATSMYATTSSDWRPPSEFSWRTNRPIAGACCCIVAVDSMLGTRPALCARHILRYISICRTTTQQLVCHHAGALSRRGQPPIRLAYNSMSAGWPAQYRLAVLTTGPTVEQNSQFSSLAMATTSTSTHFTISRRMENWADLVGWLDCETVNTLHPSTNWAWIELTNALALSATTTTKY